MRNLEEAILIYCLIPLGAGLLWFGVGILGMQYVEPRWKEMMGKWREAIERRDHQEKRGENKDSRFHFSSEGNGGAHA